MYVHQQVIIVWRFADICLSVRAKRCAAVPASFLLSFVAPYFNVELDIRDRLCKQRRFGGSDMKRRRRTVGMFSLPSRHRRGSVQVLFHCPVKGEPQKGSAQKVTFKSPKHDLNMTLKLFHGWIPFAVPLFRGSDSCLSRGTALARAAPERVSGRITCLTLLV